MAFSLRGKGTGRDEVYFSFKKVIFIIFPTTSPYGYSSFPKEEKLCRKLTKLQFIT